VKTKVIKVRDWKELERHRLSAEYPDLTPAGREQMRASLKEHGIISDRRIMLFEGKVLDGWQLYQACIEEDIEPQFQELPKRIDRPRSWRFRTTAVAMKTWTQSCAVPRCGASEWWLPGSRDKVCGRLQGKKG